MRSRCWGGVVLDVFVPLCLGWGLRAARLRFAPQWCQQMLRVRRVHWHQRHINWAHGVVVSHPLRMRKALGSIPSVSIVCPHSVVWCARCGPLCFAAIVWQHQFVRRKGQQHPIRLIASCGVFLQACAHCLFHCLARRDFHALKILLAKRNIDWRGPSRAQSVASTQGAQRAANMTPHRAKRSKWAGRAQELRHEVLEAGACKE